MPWITVLFIVIAVLLVVSFLRRADRLDRELEELRRGPTFNKAGL